MKDKERMNHSRVVRGKGADPKEAACSLFANCMAEIIGDTEQSGDRSAIVQASAPTIEGLLTNFIIALLDTADEQQIDLTDATLDGLRTADDGWRAWGAISGKPTEHPTAKLWHVEAATTTEDSGTFSMHVRLGRESAYG